MQAVVIWSVLIIAFKGIFFVSLLLPYQYNVLWVYIIVTHNKLSNEKIFYYVVYFRLNILSNNNNNNKRMPRYFINQTPPHWKPVLYICSQWIELIRVTCMLRVNWDHKDCSLSSFFVCLQVIMIKHKDKNPLLHLLLLFLKCWLCGSRFTTKEGNSLRITNRYPVRS